LIVQKALALVYETQWQVSSPVSADSPVDSSASSSARSKPGRSAWSIRVGDGRFAAAAARSGAGASNATTLGGDRGQKVKNEPERGSLAAPGREELCVSACCAALQAVQQGHRRADLLTADSPTGEGITQLRK